LIHKIHDPIVVTSPPSVGFFLEKGRKLCIIVSKNMEEYEYIRA